MLLCLLMLVKFEDRPYDLSEMIQAPMLVVNQVIDIRVDESRSRQTDGVVRRQRRGLRYEQIPIKVTEEGEALSYICRFKEAWRTIKGEKKPYDFQGYHVLFEFHDGAWHPGAYRVEGEQRTALAVDLNPLRNHAKELDRSWRAYKILKDNLPNGPVAVGASWRMDSRLIAGVTGYLEGFNESESLLRLTLVEVTDAQIVLKISGELLLEGEDYVNSLQMRWHGQIVEGRIVLRRGPYLELERTIILKESVVMEDEQKQVSGTGEIINLVTATIKPLELDE